MGAETTPWIGHLSWRASAASGCLYWALSVHTDTEIGSERAENKKGGDIDHMVLDL